MTLKPRTQVSADAANQLIRRYSNHMSCWKVGLVQGSLVYFELGRKLSKPSKRGGLVQYGSGYLSLEGFRWTAYSDDITLTSARLVTRQTAKGELAARFLGQSLIRIEVSAATDTAQIVFSDNLRIRFDVSRDPEYPDSELFVIGFPDKSYLTYCVTDGLYLEVLRPDRN